MQALEWKGPKTFFFSMSLKITIAKETERKKYRKREGESVVTLLVFILATLEKKNSLKEEIYFAVTFSKNPAKYITRNRALLFGVFF